MVKIRTPIKRTDKAKASDKEKIKSMISKLSSNVYDATDKDHTDFTYTPTGIEELDRGWGGGMNAGLNMLWGPKESGKSTLAIKIMSYVAEVYNMRTLYVDFERKMTASYMEYLKVSNIDDHKLMRPNLDMVGMRDTIKIIESDLYQLVIIDSIGAVSLLNDSEVKDFGTHQVAYRSKLVGPFASRIVKVCTDRNINVLAINQVRKNIQMNSFLSKGAPDEKHTGGAEFTHAIMNSVYVKQGGLIRKSEKIVGRKVYAKTDFNKANLAPTKFEFELFFAEPYDLKTQLFEIAMEYKIFRKRKGYLYYNKVKYSEDELREELMTDKELAAQVIAELGLANE